MPNLQNKVFQNSLNTCEYISGYENAQSIITVRCIVHNLIFQTKWENIKRDNRKHHICPKCQEEDLRKDKEKIICSYCGQEFFLSKSKLERSKSGLYFCCREHKDLAQRIDSGDKFSQIRPSHFGKTNSNYRVLAFKQYEHKCCVCGWDEDENILEVHHRNENHQDNDVNNLCIICPICHRKITSHLYYLTDDNKLIHY